jgi:hypothetical protein
MLNLFSFSLRRKYRSSVLKNKALTIFGRKNENVRFEVFTTVTMKNAVF